MNILLLGSRGMLGTAFAQAFFSATPAYRVTAWDRNELDITDEAAVQKAFAKQKPELVINCTGYTDVDGAETQSELANRINGDAVGFLALASAKVEATLVHFSTDYVFDGQNADGYLEDDKPHPLNTYGRSKALGEKLLQQNVERFYLIRTSWLYGKNGENFVKTMVELGRTKPEVRVVNDQHGKPTYTRDLAAFVVRLLEDRAPFGIYHGVNEPDTTWFAFAKTIFRLAGIATPVVPCTSREFPRPAKRPEWSTLQNAKRPALRPWALALYDYLVEDGLLEGTFKSPDTV